MAPAINKSGSYRPTINLQSAGHLTITLPTTRRLFPLNFPACPQGFLPPPAGAEPPPSLFLFHRLPQNAPAWASPGWASPRGHPQAAVSPPGAPHQHLPGGCPPPGHPQLGAPQGAHPRVGTPRGRISAWVSPPWAHPRRWHLFGCPITISPSRGDPSASPPPPHEIFFFWGGSKGGDQRQSWGRAEKGSATAAPAPCLSLPLSLPLSPQVNVPAIIFIYSRDAARMLLLIVFYQGDSFSLLKQAARKNIPIWGEG